MEEHLHFKIKHTKTRIGRMISQYKEFFLITEGSGDVVVEEVDVAVVEDVDVLIVEVQFDRIEQILSALKKYVKNKYK